MRSPLSLRLLPLFLVVFPAWRGEASHGAVPARAQHGPDTYLAKEVCADEGPPIARLERVLDAPLLDSGGVVLGRVEDLVVHRGTGLVTRAVVRVAGTDDAPAKELPYRELSWSAPLAAFRVTRTRAELQSAPDFDPARLVRVSRRWAARDTREDGADTHPPLLHCLARPLEGEPIQARGGLLGRVESVLLAPAEGRVLAWIVRLPEPSTSAAARALVPWPAVASDADDHLHLDRPRSTLAAAPRLPAASTPPEALRTLLRTAYARFDLPPPALLHPPRKVPG